MIGFGIMLYGCQQPQHLPVVLQGFVDERGDVRPPPGYVRHLQEPREIRVAVLGLIG